mgnify:CR=1 FL=1
MWFAGLWYQGITPARGNRRIGGIDIIQAGDQAFAIQNFPVIVIDDRDYITALHGQVEENPVSLSVFAFSNPVNTVVDAMPICAWSTGKPTRSRTLR